MNRPTNLAICLVAFVGCSGSLAEDFSDVPVIDTHIHLYDTTRPQGLPWPPATDKVLFRPVLPRDFDAVAQRNGITAAVVVEEAGFVSLHRPHDDGVADGEEGGAQDCDDAREQVKMILGDIRKKLRA